MKIKAKLISKTTLILFCLVLVGGCGRSDLGEKQAFSPNQIIGESNEATKVQKVQSLKIPCNYTAGGTSPWKPLDKDAKTTNSLLYDSLIRLSPEYEPVFAIAEKVEQVENTYFITVKQGIRFTDTELLKIEDVENSLTAAMSAGSAYQANLLNIRSHKILADGRLEIVLQKPDANFLNMLTFPVARFDGSFYIGTGPYSYKIHDETNLVLERNPYHWGEKSSIPEIHLVELPKQELASYSLKSRNVDCIYVGLSSDDSINLSSSNYPVVSNHLSFLGVNCLKGLLSDQNLRKAVSLAINKEYLAQAVYSSMAKPAYTPFHPDYYRIKDLTETAQTAAQQKSNNTVQVKQLLQDSGKLNENNILPLTLLYNSDNSSRAQMASHIATQLKEVGIEVELIGKAFKEYMAQLNSGTFDLYLGELEIPDNMDLSHLMTRGEGFGFGAGSFATLNQSWEDTKTTPNTQTYQTFLNEYDKYLPAIPLLYREGIFAFSRELSFSVTATSTNVFYNIDKWQ